MWLDAFLFKDAAPEEMLYINTEERLEQIETVQETVETGETEKSPLLTHDYGVNTDERAGMYPILS